MTPDELAALRTIINTYGVLDTVEVCRDIAYENAQAVKLDALFTTYWSDLADELTQVIGTWKESP